MKKYFLVLIFSILIIPQVTFAAWWNPFSWRIFSRAQPPQVEVQKVNQPSEIEKLRSEIEELKKKTNTPTAAQPKPPTSTGGTSKPVTQSVSTSVKLSNSQIISKIKPAAVYIETETSAGSGMIFSTDGYVLTNAHVVKGFTYVDVSISTGETLSGKVIGRDEQADLAVVKITSDKMFPKVSFGDSAKTEQGDEVFALGFPFGIKGDVSFKEGTISRRIESYFETSAEIHPGNSGGPLVNRYGQVIGINTAIYGKSVAGLQLGETIKLAIPINTAKNLIDDLKSGRNIVVESQEEKQAKQQEARKAPCLAESEIYYQNLVNSINQLNANDSELQSLLAQIDQQIENIRRSLNDDTSRISSQYDSLISQLRDSAERYAQSVQTSLIRSGSARYAQDSSSGTVEAARHSNDSQILLYESQKQSQIAMAQANANIYIAKYEALKAKAKSDAEKSNSAALDNAKDKKVEYYNKCLSQ